MSTNSSLRAKPSSTPIDQSHVVFGANNSGYLGDVICPSCSNITPPHAAFVLIKM